MSLLDRKKRRGHTLPTQKLEGMLPHPLFRGKDHPLAPNRIENPALLHPKICRSRQAQFGIMLPTAHGVYPVNSTYPRPDMGAPPRVPETLTEPSQYLMRVSNS
ncbi:MAG: hypothetical protein ACI9W4_000493 [Rhodothermales bacterium]|jgi:hypothetical protein